MWGTGILPVCDLDSIFQKVRLRVPFPDHVCLQTETPGQEVRQQRQDRQDQGQQRRKGSMTSLLLWKEHLKRFYNRYSYGIQPVVRFLFALCTMVSLNTNIGYMAKLKSPLVILPVCLVSAFPALRRHRVPGGLPDDCPCICGFTGDGPDCHCAHTDHCHSLLRIQARGQLSDGSDTSCLPV